MKTGKTYILLLGIVALLVVAACSTTPTGNMTKSHDILVGVLAPLSGDAAQWGLGSKTGVPLAIQQLEAQGYHIKLYMEDSQCDPKQAVTAAQKLIQQDNVDVIIGAVCSSATLAVAPLANQAQVILISPASTNPDVTTAGPYIFRVVPSDNLRGAMTAKHIYTQGNKRAAILVIDNAGGRGLAESFKKEYLKLGGKIVSEQYYAQDATSLKTELMKVEVSKPDIIVAITYVPDTLILAKDYRELGITTPLFIASEAADDPNVKKEVGKLLEGVEYIMPAVIDSQAYQAFVQAYKTEYGQEPPIFAAEAYDATKIAVPAIAESMSREEARTKVAATSNYDGASGPITFDQNGDVTKPYSIKAFINGETKEVARVG